MNKKTIFQWWDLFRSENPLTEIRILGRGKTYSGYFTDREMAAEQIAKFENCGGIYATLNDVKDPCYGRSQHDEIMMAPKSTTNDNDIERRCWILIDFDPERPSDTNASDAEKELALLATREVYRFLRDEGFYSPIVADSGNGYHLYYKVDMDNTPESTETVKRFLQALDALFSNDQVKVDTSVFNAARIVKLIGTTSMKGKSTKDRPQRESFFMDVPDVITATPTAFVKKVAALIPEPEQPSRHNGYLTAKFDLDGFISQHNIEVVRRSRFAGGEKIILKQCPFDPNHKDAAILHLDNGAIAFKCFHNSCSQYNWKDFRIHYDPEAYTRTDTEDYKYKRKYYGKSTYVQAEPIKEDARGKIWLDQKDIKWVDPSKVLHIPTGITALDEKILGFGAGEVTVISGSSGAGKTTILDTFALSAIQRGYKVAVWSGELTDTKFNDWFDQMAAGKEYVRKMGGPQGREFYYCPKNVAEKIHEWTYGYLYIFNNEYGSEWGGLLDAVRKQVTENDVKLIMLDNLMAIDVDGPSDNDVQTRLIKDLKNLAREFRVHVVLVCHPRKEHAFQLIRKDSIAGTANLTNLCDNLLIVHRVGRDFEKRAKEFFGSAETLEMLNYATIVEVAKNRSHGVVDETIGLLYEPETRRILNNKDEHIIYGWKEPTTPAPMFSFPEPYRPEPPAIRLHDEPDEDIPDDAWDEEAEDKLKNQS